MQETAGMNIADEGSAPAPEMDAATDRIAVSAIMTACTREAKTLDSLQRILDCRPAPAEVLVHVDGGNHHLAATIKEKFPVTRVIVSDEHLGPGGARNLLVRSASHELVASFDDDSYPTNSDYFAVVASEFERYPRASLLFAAVTDCYAPMGPQLTAPRRSAAFVGCGCVYRRSSFLATSGYVPLQLAYGMEEVDLSMKLHAQGSIIVQSPNLMVYHNTDMRHRATPEINAATTANAALLVYLRYPVLLWPVGFMQFLKTVVGLVKEGRSQGIWSGLAGIPAHFFRHREHRKTLRAGELISYLSLRRRCARENVPAE